MRTKLQIIPIPAFKDNYIWLIHDGQAAIVIDPGDHQPVLAQLAKHKLDLRYCLITHHHHDHIGGVAALQAQQPNMQVLASSHNDYTFAYQAVGEADVLSLTLTQTVLTLKVLHVPGHTLAHIAFYAPAQQWLFCGDTLFSAGCGRLFEGTPAQMLAALQRFCTLPDATQVYCTHEYTTHNLHFALSLEPQHPALLSRLAAVNTLRSQDKPSLPSTMLIEKNTNPFLRCNESGLKKAIKQPNADELATFTEIRRLRNNF